MKSSALLLLLGLLSFGSMAQNPVGFFENHADIGKVLQPGTATFDKTNQTYVLTGSGENIWFKKDELHFLYRKTIGDFIATTQATLSGKGTDAHRKTGWMYRSSLDTSAAMVSLTVHADGLTAFQYRKKTGTNIEEIKTPVVHPDVLQLERRGRSFFVSVAKIGNPFWTVEIPDFDLPQEMLLGLFVCAPNKNQVEEAKLTQTRIFTAVK
jgi:regulation of enolase protein 1 (concanavalin A-like superfamily)